MNAEVVHQRDVSNILSRLQQEMDDVQKKYQDFPEKTEQLNKELNSLIQEADRDLKLKMHAILRARLSKSRTLPIQATLNIAASEERAKTSLGNKALPPLRSPKSQSVLERVLHGCTPQPIDPIEIQQNRSSTQQKIARGRIINEDPIVLPKRNFHDPSEPVPKITSRAIDKFGINDLEGRGLLSEESKAQQLSSLMTISPFQYDLTQVIGSPTQSYKLDKSNHRRNDINTTPALGSGKSVASSVKPIDEGTENTQYLIQLQNGVPVKDSDGYVSFRKENDAVWESIEVILLILKYKCEQMNLSKVNVNSNAILDLLQYDPDEIPEEKILSCFVDIPREKIGKISYKVTFGLDNREKNAAIVIQSIFRGYFARRKAKLLQNGGHGICLIQRWWRKICAFTKLKESIVLEKKRRKLQFEAIMSDPHNFQYDAPHIRVEILDTYSPLIYGTIYYALKRHIVLVLFFPEKISPEQLEAIKKYMPENSSVYIMPVQQRLPKTLSPEDKLACDSRTLAKIKQVAGPLPIQLRPTRPNDCLLEISAKLGCSIIASTDQKTSSLQERLSIKGVFELCKIATFKYTDMIFDRDLFSRTIADLEIAHLDILKWIIRCGDGSLGWITTDEFNMILQLRSHKEMLTQEEVEDPEFRNLLASNITTELPRVLHVNGDDTPANFLQRIWIHGCYVEEAPRMVKSNPCVLINVFPSCINTKPHIVVTWENVFVSPYESFARIYPAFTVDNKQLREKVESVGDEFNKRMILGYSTISFYKALIHDSADSHTDTIIGDDIIICSNQDTLWAGLALSKIESDFDQSSFCFQNNKTVYVQEIIQAPNPIQDLNEFNNMLRCHNIPVESKVFFFPDSVHPNILGLVIVENDYSSLLDLVHRTLCVLVEFIFKLENDPQNILYKYCESIESIRSQFTDKVDDINLCLNFNF